MPTTLAAVTAVEVWDAVAYPAFEPVTWTVIALPASAAFSVYVAAVAPPMAVPSANHW